MIVVDYAFYTGTYGGSAISSEDFNTVQTKATLILDSMASADILGLTTDKLDENLLLKYKMCVCNLCDGLSALFEEGISKGTIKTEKIGSWSTTYAVKDGSTAFSSLSRIVNSYLAGTWLICMWV